MAKEVIQSHHFYGQTQKIFILSKLLLSPLDAMYSLLAFIFYKDLNASPLQLTLLVSLKPAIALFSFYGTWFIKDKPQKLKSFLAFTIALGVLPCLFFPFTNHVGYFIFAFALFMLASRARTPAWTEILKINLMKDHRSKIFSRASSLCYLSSIFIPLVISPIIDHEAHSWKWIFFLLALGQLINIILVFFLKLRSVEDFKFEQDSEQSFTSLFVTPWKNCWKLMKEKPEFRGYQIVFLLGGSGLMMMHPVLPIFFKETLNLSYTQLSLALCLCKAIGFACASPFWSKWLHKISIHQFNCFVTLSAGFFAAILVTSSYYFFALYAAYIIYGLMQAGSELSWNLSGPIFSKEKDSTQFTGVNVAMVGLRGSLIPFFGELLFLYSNSTFVIEMGGALCFIASLYSFWLTGRSKKLKDTTSLTVNMPNNIIVAANNPP